MEKNKKSQNQNNNLHPIDDKDDEEDIGMKYIEILDQGRKLIEEKQLRLAEFFVTLANLEPKCDIISKIKSIGILTFVRIYYKDSSIMDYLIHKIEKILRKNPPSKFEFNNIFCMIRVFYRAGMVKIHEENIISGLYLFKKAKSLFEEGRVENEESSQKTIIKCFDEAVEKFKKEVNLYI
jgi:hypothetical protein